MAGFLDELLPVRRIVLDNVVQPFARDLLFDSDDFDVVVDETARTATINARCSTVAGDSAGLCTVTATDFSYEFATKCRLHTHLDSVVTTDATVTTIYSFTLAEGCTVVEVKIIGVQTGSGNSAVYKLKRRFENASSVVTAGSLVTIESDEDTAGWDATIDNSGTTCRVRVTGAAATTIRWASAVEVLEVEP